MVTRTITLCDRCDEDVIAMHVATFWREGDRVSADLCADHFGAWNELRERFEDFLHCFTLVGPASRMAPPERAKTRSRANDEANRKIREWAREQGMDLPPRGRIPDGLRARWQEAMGQQAQTRWTGVAQSVAG